MAVEASELKGRKLGRVLTKMGLVTREQVHEALGIQKTRRVPIGQLLVELEYCTQADVDAALAGQAGMEFIDLTGLELEDDYFRGELSICEILSKPFSPRALMRIAQEILAPEPGLAVT